MIPQNDIVDFEYQEPPSKTWFLDHKSKRIISHIDGKNAVVQAAYCAIQTQRYEHIIFSWQYGSELHTLIGKDEAYVFSEAKRMIKEALSVDTRITEVRDFAFENGVISFVIDTIFGSEQLTMGVGTV
ncbi:hypothetical protein Q428_08660 [Fervidicella metallireducens AeB]|uniref:Phage protein n=1 Tax=Fervidicella metallireducens AeB TaxID=1403537 RepID=A0A017RUG6_9CLOT|nr:DUF2634 domain-containing protein [Fervidicella metallireducens]EYE88261.1 hypothetical protein Q428_08660 [Fervidicella metallireducens AeB]